jgi:ribosomal-protein-alanine N-acetyltransferase
MQHFGTKRLETERLVLRPFVMGDAPAMYRNWASDPEVTKYLTWSAYSSEETAVVVLTEWTAMYPDPTFYQWAIELKSLGEPIGSISVVQYDDRAELAHIGYCIGKKWWNQGIMTEALREVMDYLFAEVGVNRVESQPYCSQTFMSCLKQYVFVACPKVLVNHSVDFCLVKVSQGND